MVGLKTLIVAFRKLPSSIKNNVIREYISTLDKREKEKLVKDNADLFMKEFFEVLSLEQLEHLANSLHRNKVELLRNLLNKKLKDGKQ